MTNKIIAGLFLSLIFSGCVTERKRNKICQTCPTETKTDTVISQTIRDSISIDTLTLPPDSAWYMAWLKCKDGSIPKIYQEKSKQGKRTVLKASIDSMGILTAKCNEDSLQAVIESKNKIIDNYIRINSTSTIQNTEKNGWNEFLRFSGIAFWILLLIYVSRKIFN